MNSCFHFLIVESDLPSIASAHCDLSVFQNQFFHPCSIYIQPWWRAEPASVVIIKIVHSTIFECCALFTDRLRPH